uniref:Gamma-secretase subunit PEN-2 n=1 Tax=Chaetoceros debilis TaxID=122233 RepID=A0A7S3VH86_9STRA|mmetsp:Transcript_16953/g.25512  ORF Transcript_16953/g.25512 Transcript_16953/m.25512 type:complete len:142 (+) Transcript_16953:178-603(+)|eukprot:CAMPEP_0194083166 /NCGR_PEP_ID=MMETSP0149-20130528/8485_1 /TAXON_ID=122233 /ORGANISM="Chaetoceros debilis, Strain MM31A-1" /LENGTH=141 /DNA_ID=CAMNT_0038765507 /DNA_START=145 /DNA_END=570 /DNA_ORIENTATION=-
MSLPRPDTNAKYMFFVGLLGLPWLWIVNVAYHWKQVYGKVPLPCFGSSNSTEDGSAAQNHDEDNGIMDTITQESGDNDNEVIPPPEEIKAELTKWVKRSTLGSFIYTTAFITWVLVFQLNRDKFGPKWFIMSEDEEIRTGW